MRPLRALLASALLTGLLAATACTPSTTRGAAIGAAAGAGLGALNGGVIRNAATVAAVGAAGGYLYDVLDQRAEAGVAGMPRLTVGTQALTFFSPAVVTAAWTRVRVGVSSGPVAAPGQAPPLGGPSPGLFGAVPPMPRPAGRQGRLISPQTRMAPDR